MRIGCAWCGGKRRPRRAKFRVRRENNERATEAYACGYHLVTAVTEASGQNGQALVRPLPEED